MKQVIVIYLIWNLISFIVMGIDKYKAKKNKWRISEKTLLSIAFFMGGLGSLIGSYMFRHKTQKIKFNILLPVSVFCNLLVIYIIIQYII